MGNLQGAVARVGGVVAAEMEVTQAPTKEVRQLALWPPCVCGVGHAGSESNVERISKAELGLASVKRS
jgi:hypothetical protein